MPAATIDTLQENLSPVLAGRTVVAPEPLPPSKSTKPKSTLNLQELLKATPTSPEKKTPGTAPPPEVKLPVLPDALRSAWEDFAEQRRDQVAEYQLLRRDFQFESPIIKVTLANPVEETLLENFKRELLQFLREKLQNGDLSIVPVHQTTQAQKVAYTSREKFEHLAEKNPMLLQLKERLGLDWDF